jgi:hypothetical protein
MVHPFEGQRRVSMPFGHGAWWGTGAESRRKRRGVRP